MCGIVGYIGNKNCCDILLNGLKKLEYRGYDSAGIALKEEKITIFKDAGKVAHLETILNKNIDSNIGIGHTRWATHGKPNKINSHPHLSFNQRFALVHNGVIENYLFLKEKYLKDIKFVSETDSEVIVNLLAKLCENHTVIDSLKKLNHLLKGSFALAIIDKENDALYFMKNQTPLTIGFNHEENIIASDTIAFPERFDQQIILNDGDYGFIKNNKIVIYDSTDKLINYHFLSVEKEKKVFINDSFQYHMEKEIHDQPLLIQEIINHYFINQKRNINPQIIQNINECDKIYIIACGSSYYSGNIGKYYFETFLHKMTEVLLASEALYSFPLLTQKPFFIFVSQSGETLDVINIVKECKRRKIKNLAITNAFNSTITHLCDDICYLYAGREISVASTKAFLGQCLIFLILSNNNLQLNDLLLLKKEIENILLKKEQINSISQKIMNYHDVFYLGRNLDYFIALEGALKLKEISYIHAEAFASGELKHGSLALIDETTSIIGLISQEKTASITRTNIMESTSRGAEAFIISKKSLSKEKDHFILNDLPNYLIPLSELIFVQLLAFYTAKNKGNEVDTPRNLAKSVTVE